jgi:hypothetical protein
MNFGKEIAKRLKELVIKLLSFKTIVASVATWLLIIKLIPAWQWFTLTSLCVGIRELSKYIPIVKDKTE